MNEQQRTRLGIDFTSIEDTNAAGERQYPNAPIRLQTHQILVSDPVFLRGL